MNALTWTSELKQIFEHAVAQYRAGRRGSDSYFTPTQLAALAAIGHTAQEVYDFAEDHTNYGQPDWETFLLIASVRRDYFLNVQQGVLSSHRIDMDRLPPKSEAVDGIEWLPRLVQKAQAKLRGEMPDDLMYDCGGDRRFFAQWNVHPADFLRFAWSAGADVARYVPFVRGN
ncbi:MAG: DUF5069 domain-containing protein [Verrucomicrobia bacterium]|nr:DUF5069 domain-containing protein [Verrucomicrobiota bacterium]